MKKSPRERVLERALEMAVQMFMEQTDGCRDCPLYDLVNSEFCTEMDCKADITAHFIRLATKEAKGEKL